MATSQDAETIESFTCSICREIFKDPVILPCGNNHTMCRDCVLPLLKEEVKKCPTCRTDITSVKGVKRNSALKIKMRKTHLPCFGCNEQICVNNMNEHIASCDRIDKRISYFKPVKETTQIIPTDLPNRCTFKCPYCDVKNLEARGLKEHCIEHHRYDSQQVVCPICASMPWGNKNQASSDFLKHLDMRHKFEYDTYVDYSQDDDAMLQAAIRASLQSS
ncbi:E3 ubiquitin-protein ligase RNF166-like [Dreissena polymorpha]|uniref:RING-type domain-containing protein n=1 Tax=Dreissena polymorpha TaxID=45954 RepID=A0A9D4LDE6_DREPO|nr:E3 ubiquitin-protein ligase RNF166-like [Dreissena polymorpha]KAH3855177.1 hypothetical protein DPMN_097739 [Dreissena polymorpha]